ncbi:MAG: phosphate/phosphite/phosphonate ABC transporter substrate-binding protein [Deltaproteobacteria bacterium]|nr:phosphate/phosphite/phosphonate ABC transporter substrate-binding protein [Deltaproteobacteria bacterium]
MPSITLAVVPSATPGDSRAALVELCTELGKLLDAQVRCIHPESYTDLTSELEKDRVQFAWMPPALLVMGREHIQLRALLSAERYGSTEYCGALFVDAERSIRTIEDLRGKTIAWVDQTSAAGYLYPRLAIAAQGLDPDRFFGRELFLRSHAEVVRAVFDGRADAGATYAQRPTEGERVRGAGFTDVAPDRKARVLGLTGAIPNDLIVGHGLLPKPEHRIFGNAILTLCERDDGRRLLYNAFHTERFVVTPRTTLEGVWDQVRLARMHGLLTHL